MPRACFIHQRQYGLWPWLGRGRCYIVKSVCHSCGQPGQMAARPPRRPPSCRLASCSTGPSAGRPAGRPVFCLAAPLAAPPASQPNCQPTPARFVAPPGRGHFFLSIRQTNNMLPGEVILLCVFVVVHVHARVHGGRWISHKHLKELHISLTFMNNS